MLFRSLTVYVEGINYSCQWYAPSGNAIEGATSETITVDASTGAGIYRCHVSDVYGNEQDVLFEVHIENGLWIPETSGSGCVEYDDPYEFYVRAEANDTEGLAYQWYTRESDSDDWEEIIGANGSAYTVEHVRYYRWYKCVVTDKYGNTAEAWFDVYVSNDFGVYPVNYEYDVRVPYGEDAVLELFANGNDLEGLTYEWYRYEKVEHGEEDDIWIEMEWVLDEASTGNTYAVSNVTELVKVKYVATDKFGYIIESIMTVGVDNGFMVEPLMPSRFIVSSGGSQTITINASSYDNDLTYEWQVYGPVTYGSEEEGYLDWYTPEGADGNTLTLSNITSYTEGYCRVSDKYGNSEDRWFYIYPDTEPVENYINIYANCETEQTVSAGCVSMSVWTDSSDETYLQ